MPCEDKSRAIFLDADGVLWNDRGPGGILGGKDQAVQNLIMFLEIPKKQYLKIIISNQTFAARKKINYFKFRLFVNKFFKDLITQELLNDFAICYHHPNAENKLLRKKCKCRKPSPRLINSMIRKYNIDPLESFLIGDRITDIQAGSAAGVGHLFLIISSKMLEINFNLNSQSLQNEFVPLNGLEEFIVYKKMLDEN